jgi:hypothetical protein
MTEQDQRTDAPEWLAVRLGAERERARRLRAATSALAAGALGLVVSLGQPWAVSGDENSPDFDPTRALQLDEPGPWRADGWFLLRDAVGHRTLDGSELLLVMTLVPLLCAVVGVWALVRQDHPSALAARLAGGLGVVGLLVIGVRVVAGPGVDLGSGFWLAVGSSAVLVVAGSAVERARRIAGA